MCVDAMKASTLLDLAKLVGQKVGVQMRSEGGASVWVVGTLRHQQRGAGETGSRDPVRFVVSTVDVCGVLFHVSMVDSLLIIENDVSGRAAVIWLK